ncbi:hypothetical protein NURINAE_00437 [Candidatus Nitrosacidococcus sp. I8]|nr:hypothetical protein NURINAE_00437 [Candidatus Nitrosacidococcus sp. I8]
MLGAQLPDDFIVFYKIHNGQISEGPSFIDCEEWLSFEGIEYQWKVWKELLDGGAFSEGDFKSSPDIEVKNDWWHPCWIPITYDGSGNHYCLDLVPTKEGNHGQIIRMWHDDDIRPLIASSFTAWIEDYKNKLIRGQLIYSEDYFGIIDEEELEN